MLVHAFITCHLDQCNYSLLYGLPESQITKLQRIQNSAARLVTLSRKYDHITLILRELHWFPVKYRIMYKILLLVYKCLHQFIFKNLSRNINLLAIFALLRNRVLHVLLRQPNIVDVPSMEQFTTSCKEL